MPFSSLLAIFITVFLAELGDKTQLATMLFASENNHSPWLIFAAASVALAASSAVAVLLGATLSKELAWIPLKLVAGIGFVMIGAWTVMDHYRG